MIYLVLLMVLLKAITAHAAEDREAYRAVFDADYYYNHDLLDVCKTDLSAYCKHYTTMGKTEGRICLPQDDERKVIGTYSTSYDVTLPRAVNIGLAIQRIHGTVLQPGEAFSFSSAVLPRNAKKWLCPGPGHRRK